MTSLELQSNNGLRIGQSAGPFKLYTKADPDQTCFVWVCLLECGLRSADDKAKSRKKKKKNRGKAKSSKKAKKKNKTKKKSDDGVLVYH